MALFNPNWRKVGQLAMPFNISMSVRPFSVLIPMMTTKESLQLYRIRFNCTPQPHHYLGPFDFWYNSILLSGRHDDPLFEDLRRYLELAADHRYSKCSNVRYLLIGLKKKISPVGTYFVSVLFLCGCGC